MLVDLCIKWSRLVSVCFLWFKNISERIDWFLSLLTVRSSRMKGVGDSLEAATLTRVRKRSRGPQELGELGHRDPLNGVGECLSHSQLETGLVE